MTENEETLKNTGKEWLENFKYKNELQDRRCPSTP